MKLKLIQSNCSAINSVYIFENFLENINYLELLKNEIVKYTSKSNELDYKTNVIAKMTNWYELLKNEHFHKIHVSILETLYNVINLRNPTTNEKLNIEFLDSWGMKHEEGDYTKDHIHTMCNFSGAFYFDVPTPTTMWFEDYQASVDLKDNMLVLFPGMCKHRVGIHQGEKPRYSMAFNININVVD